MSSVRDRGARPRGAVGPDRAAGLLAKLPAARIVRHEDALALVQRRALFERGIGWVDVHLAASALVDRWPLWTLDRRLGAVARDLKAAWEG